MCAETATGAYRIDEQTVLVAVDLANAQAVIPGAGEDIRWRGSQGSDGVGLDVRPVELEGDPCIVVRSA